MKIYINLLFFTTIIGLQLQAQPYYQEYLNSPTQFTGSQSMTMISDDIFQISNALSTPTILNKVDPSGNLLWSKTFAIVSGTLASTLVLKSTGTDLLLTGTANVPGAFYGNYFLKTDTSGNVLWAKYLNYNDIPVPTRIHSDGNNYYVTGYRDYQSGGGGYTYDNTIAKLDAGGNLIWAKAYGDNTYSYSNEASALTPDGGLITAGEKALQFQTNTDADLVVARFDSSGSQLWGKVIDFGTFFVDFDVSDMVGLPDSSFVIAGSPKNTNGNQDLVLLRIDSAGNVISAIRYYQIGYYEVAQRLMYDSQGNIAVLGMYGNTTTLTDQGYFILKTDLAGNILGSATQIVPTDVNYFWAAGNHSFEEKNGSGYTINGLYKSAGSPGWYNTILETDYSGTIPCSALVGSYAFSTAILAPTATNVVNFDVDNSVGFGSINASFTDTVSQVLNDLCIIAGITDEPANSSTISMYPLPATDFINCYWQTGSIQKIHLKILDAMGKLVYSTDCSGPDFRLETSNYANGIYFMELQSGNENARRKFVVEN